MTNFIEELDSGDCFMHVGCSYILTIDAKKDRSRLCIELKTGSPRWLSPETIVNKIGIFYTDIDSNIVAIKEAKKENATN